MTCANALSEPWPVRPPDGPSRPGGRGGSCEPWSSFVSFDDVMLLPELLLAQRRQRSNLGKRAAAARRKLLSLAVGKI
jgi:hypothetical protein